MPEALPVSDALAVQLEEAEIAAFLRMYRAAPTDVIETRGICVAEADSAYGLIAAKVDTLLFNRIVGLGLTQPATESQLDYLVNCYRKADVPRFLAQVHPLAKPPELVDWLLARGFRYDDNWVRLFRDLAVPPPRVDAAFEVRQVGQEMAEAFAEIVGRAFGFPPAAAAWDAAIVGQPGWRHYLAFDGEVPMAAGALFVHGERAWIGAGATNQEYRRRGAQSVLIARRIKDAAAAGAKFISVETAEQTPEYEVPSYRNILRAGFRPAYTRPNYILTFKG